jgi:hypothetical protein
MEKITGDAIKAVVAIIIGAGAILSFKEFLAGSILIVAGVVIIGVNENLRILFLSFIKWLWDKITGEETQSMEDSPGGIQQQAKRDTIVGDVVNTGEIIHNITINKNHEDYDKKIALKTIYKEMVKPLRRLNLAANVGVKNQKEFDEISESIDEFINAKMENELEFDDELLNKLNEVMGAFKDTSDELFTKVFKKRFNEGLHGLKSFDFVMKCEEATNMIKNRIR